VSRVAESPAAQACVAIPIVLIYFIRHRRDLPFPAIFWLLGAVILGCGLTHFLEVLTVVRVVTSAVCWSTILPLVRVTPKALAMRSPEELEQEIAERTRVEQALRQSEAIFRHVAQVANDAIISADHQGHIPLGSRSVRARIRTRRERSFTL
jgi:PAS domain-containing protein